MQVLIVCAVALLGASSVLGQSVEGLLFGAIQDAETGEGLGRATVVAIARDTTGTYADLRGNFRLRLRAGSYRVRVSMVGYAPSEREISLPSGDTLRLIIRLYPVARQMEGVVVEARREWGSTESAVSVRRSATEVKEVVAAEQMQATGDADVGQVLQRVSSVSVVEGKYLFIRGTSERYSTILLNGLPVAMTGPDRRAISLELFPTELLEQVTVAKSAAAEVPVAAGGVVEFQTLDIPDRPFLQLRGGSPYVTGTSFRRGVYQHYPAGHRDWLAWDADWRCLPQEAPRSRQEMNTLLSAAWNPYDTTGARQRWAALGRAFNNSSWRRDTGVVTFLPTMQLAAGWRSPTGTHSEFGLLGMLTYERSASTHGVFWRGLLADKSLLFEHGGSESLRGASLAALFNAGYRFNSAHRLHFRNVFSRTLNDRYLFLEGQDKGYQFLDLRHYVYHLTQYQFWTTQLGGSHALNGYAVEWELSRGEARQQQPDYRRLRYQRQTYGDPSEPFVAEIPATQQGDGTRAGRYFTDLLEKTMAAQSRGRLPLTVGSLRMGLHWERRQRGFTARSFTLIQARGGARNVDLSLPPDELLRPENFREDGLGISEDTKLSDSYRAKEEIWATYALGELPLNVHTLPLRLAVGVRAELAQQRLSTHLVNEQPVEEYRRWLNWLPTFNAVVLLSERVQLRGALFRSVTRPTFRELAPFAFFDVAEQALVQGNPLLKPAEAWNAELRWEWYLAPAEYISIGAFAKRISNALEETIFPQQSELTRTFANAVEPAHLWGGELELRKNLAFLGTWGSNLTIFGNYSIVHGRVGVRSGGMIVERPLWGQAPYTLNAGAIWLTPWRGELSLVWNRVGRRIMKVGQPEQYAFADPHVYELPRDAVDVVYRQPLLAGISISFKARNVLGQPIRWQQGGMEVHRRTEPRTLSLSVGYRLE
ncbi:MAG: TonB-dependent receptor [Bacteroidota bacterium]|nr:TonB-dependent receptor [Bacteroidota bacterium]